MEDSAVALERQRLEDTRAEMLELLGRDERIFAGLPRKYGDEPRLLENMMTLYGTRIRSIKAGLGKPYFARIDFRREGAEDPGDRFYIGKVGLADRKGGILITDWRAPVSSLYYSSNLGRASYEAPEGLITGELQLKRQILIENGELVSIFDVDAVSDDELLRPYLGASADNRLKNIVASIQKEQNDIIRRPLRDSVVVQGVAGSGKTTVALHRIAYLVYNYQSRYQAEQFLVIGPNKFFINYISSVLPDLDVGGAEQRTFEELALEYVGERFTLQDPTETLTGLLHGEKPDAALGYKTSMAYKRALDRFFAAFEEELLGGEGLAAGGFPLLSGQELLERCRACTAPDPSARLALTERALAARFRSDAELENRIREWFAGQKAASPAEERELFARRTDTLKQLESGFATALKKRLSLSKVKVLALYRRFAEQAEDFAEGRLPEGLSRDTARAAAKKQLGFEDVPALMYLKYLLSGSGRCAGYIHTVVDEAQDFGAFHFYVLRLLLSKSSFSIFGDLTQGIYGYRAIGSWEEVRREAFGGECGLMQLEKSYRTTIEIMEAANLLARHMGLPEGRPVIRSGDPVAVRHIAAEQLPDRLCAFLAECGQRAFASVAILCKTAEKSRAVCAGLSERGVSAELIDGDRESYEGGVCVLPCYLAKGLEFDAVVICDADENSYRSALDMKLLYVAMTRALHRLELFCGGELPLPLRPLEACRKTAAARYATFSPPAGYSW